MFFVILPIVIVYVKTPAGMPTGLMLLLPGVFLLLIPLFYRLTVEVTETHINVIFGVGLIKRKILLSEIQSCEAVTNKWYWGWGIRYIGEGWMWNITGLKGVRLHYNDGRSFRIGTDQPDKLQMAITSRLKASKERV